MVKKLKFPQLTADQCTLTVGGEVIYPSSLEAAIFMSQLKFREKAQDIALVCMEFSNGNGLFSWGIFNKKGKLLAACPVFNEIFPQGSQIKSVKALNIGTYMKEEDKYYLPFESNEFGVILRELVVFSTANDARAVWELSQTEEDEAEEDEDDELDLSLVRVTKVNNPHETVCIAWLMEKGGIMKLHPVFAEEAIVLNEQEINTLNWEYLDEGQMFGHEGDLYIVQKDDDGEYYLGSPCIKASA